MKFIKTKLMGVHIIELLKFEDDRGFFARSFCRREFESHGLNPDVVQCNISYNKKKGTLRGMHYQTAPYIEAKLVSCIRGAIYDVIIDIRPDSSTYRQWLSVELAAQCSRLNAHYRMLYIPEGCAHGFLTLENDTEVFYQMSEFYMPEYARGIRWNDPAFGITWPMDVSVISEKDKKIPNFSFETE